MPGRTCQLIGRRGSYRGELQSRQIVNGAAVGVAGFELATPSSHPAARQSTSRATAFVTLLTNRPVLPFSELWIRFSLSSLGG